jgi:hypothetical protein
VVQRAAPTFLIYLMVVMVLPVLEEADRTGVEVEVAET